MGSSESSILSNASQDIQNDLKCHICNEFLTWFPIILHPEKGNVCGRCPIIKNGIRNKGMEAIIKQLVVPCRYDKHGCEALLRYNNNDDNIRNHEQNCNCRTFYCPSISSKNNCVWKGKRIDIQRHYKEEHEDLIFKSGKELNIDLKVDMIQNIMVDSKDKIFFVHIKYEMKSQKIYCGLIALQQPSAENSGYEFTISLKVGTKSFTDKCKNYRMAENFLLDNKNLHEIDLNKMELLVLDSKLIKYSLIVVEV